MYEALEASTEQVQTSWVDFIFCEHSPGNLARVADAMLATDADIIAIEKIREGSFGMGTVEEKRALSERMTRFIAADADIPQSAGEYFQTDEPFFTRLLDGLKGSGKRVVLIDMGSDDPRYELYRESRQALQAYRDHFMRPLPRDEAWVRQGDDLLLDYKVASARMDEYREYTMRRQITELLKETPGSRVAVMAGAMHSPMSYHALDYETDDGSAVSVAMSRTFVSTVEDAASYLPGEKMRFPRTGRDIRFLRLHLGDLGLSTLADDGELVAA